MMHLQNLRVCLYTLIGLKRNDKRLQILHGLKAKVPLSRQACRTGEAIGQVEP